MTCIITHSYLLLLCCSTDLILCFGSFVTYDDTLSSTVSTLISGDGVGASWRHFGLVVYLCLSDVMYFLENFDIFVNKANLHIC